MIIAHKRYVVLRPEVFPFTQEKFLCMNIRNVGEKVFKIFLFSIFVKNLIVHHYQNIRIKRFDEDDRHNSSVYSPALDFKFIRTKKICKSYSKTSSLLKGYIFTKRKIISCKSTRVLFIHTMI